MKIKIWPTLKIEKAYEIIINTIKKMKKPIIIEDIRSPVEMVDVSIFTMKELISEDRGANGKRGSKVG